MSQHRCPRCGSKDCPPEFTQGDCSECGDEEVLLTLSEDESQPLHYVCKECFLRGC